MIPLLSAGHFRAQADESLECFFAAIERVARDTEQMYNFENNAPPCKLQLVYFTGEREARRGFQTFIQSIND